METDNWKPDLEFNFWQETWEDPDTQAALARLPAEDHSSKS